MKFPNFRKYDTQATTSLVIGIAGLGCLLVLAVTTFKGLDTEHWRIPYNSELGLSALRRPVVFLSTAICLVLGAAASIIGFLSLGQKRNNRQSQSWTGLLLGAVTVPLAMTIFFAWRMLSESLILAK